MPAPSRQQDPLADLVTELCSTRSFFNLRLLPLSPAELAEVIHRDFAPELRVARAALERSVHHALELRRASTAGTGRDPSEDATSGLGDLGVQLVNDRAARSANSGAGASLGELAEPLSDLGALCDALLAHPKVTLEAWSSVGRLLNREFQRPEVRSTLRAVSNFRAASNLQPPLLAITRRRDLPRELAMDLQIIFTALADLVAQLRPIASYLKRDAPLKSSLPLFTLIHSDARKLNHFISARAMRSENLARPVFDALDAMYYAINMELRKVFARELVGLSTSVEASFIYSHVENAHGLLRDCFQQSTVGLAQVFEPSLDGASLFDSFQTKLEQSLALRRDLWFLQQMVSGAEKERDRYPLARLLEQTAAFREGSLRYLMYKDWETCERFMEEVAAARGATETTPVLHRFGAYLETLLGQISMRAVLSDQPFDYPPLKL